MRTQAAQGTALPLKAKALALRYGNGRPAVLVTADLLGLTARLTDAVASEVRKRTGITRSQLLFSASRTHCGPVIYYGRPGPFTPDVEERVVREVRSSAERGFASRTIPCPGTP